MRLPSVLCPLFSALCATGLAVTASAITPYSFLAPSVPTYVRGVYGLVSSIDNTIPVDTANNLGLVGVNIGVDWNEVETSDGVYYWNDLDARIADAVSKGVYNINFGVQWSSSATPNWLISYMQAHYPSEVLTFYDSGHIGSSYCHPLFTATYWSPYWTAKRLALIAAMGAHFNSPSYANRRFLRGVFCSFLNHRTMDWNVSDSVFAFGTDGPQCDFAATCTALGLSTPCSFTDDQPARWLAAGWQRALVLQAGKDLCDAVAAAFPTMVLRMPIGGLDSSLANTSPDPRDGGTGVYKTLADEIQEYVKTKPYGKRFYVSRNTVATTWGSPPSSPPSRTAQDPYIKYFIATAPYLAGSTTIHRAGLQTVTSASMCIEDNSTPCRLAGSEAIGPGHTYTTLTGVMQAALNVMVAYNGSYVEMWPDDARNPDFYTMTAAATVAMGGTPR